MEQRTEDRLRVAVEGCGHGTLNDIYAAVEQSCNEKGWDDVDVLIIGGDFQAVRNKQDLNVTAMPAKYREMADFHEYYSGVRTAPCLTIFIGGNHEASNHLFELYYGGWVAPNIYYMGAANVLQVGNLRVAGMSGIWKGYDYRKPHYERLPYNNTEMYGIYHVRELDVRKLLAIRSQVDIGISHDWPQTVEWSGDWGWLFRKKDRFQYDAENAKLGNTAAKMVLDRLRPKHWFSAHLHIRYRATYNHENPQGIQTKDGKLLPRAEHKEQLSAWHEFHESAKQVDTDDHQRYLENQKQRQKEEQENGFQKAPTYIFNETFKKVTMDDDLTRKVSFIRQALPTDNAPSQLDGGCASRPLKRQRENNGSPDQPGRTPRSPRYQALGTPAPRDVALGNDEMEPLPTAHSVVPVAGNPDALDVDLSDEEEMTAFQSKTSNALVGKNPDEIDVNLSDGETAVNMPVRSGSPFPDLNAQGQSRKSDLSEDGGMNLNPQAFDFVPDPAVRRPSNSSKSSLDPTTKDFEPRNGHISPRKSTDSDLRPDAADFQPTDNTNQLDDIPDEIRAELTGLSKTFEAPIPVEVSPPLPFPEEITNKSTHFLALDKCLPGRHFLELLEVSSLSSPDTPISRPIKLRYDPEWLAILRTFATELKLGGQREDRVPPHRGDTYYDNRILEERKWVFEHIVVEGKLEVHENFEITAPVYDAQLEVPPGQMPREVTNPQTSAFCDLIGIENLFDVDEEERDARVRNGPRTEENSRSGGGGGRGGRGRRGGGGGGGWGGGGAGRGFGGGGGRGGGGRGGFGRGRGRGGGRGRFY